LHIGNSTRKINNNNSRWEGQSSLFLQSDEMNPNLSMEGGLKRQELNMDIGKEPPWSPELKKTEP
jgi:hypothetical protein